MSSLALADLHPVELDAPGVSTAPVLAVVAEAGRVNPALLRHAALAARQRSAPLQVVLVYVPIGFTTDAAVVRLAARRRARQLDQLSAQLGRLLPTGNQTTPELVAAPRRPWRRWRTADRRAWRAIERTARSRAAQLVVAPASLATSSQPASRGEGPPLVIISEPGGAALPARSG